MSDQPTWVQLDDYLRERGVPEDERRQFVEYHTSSPTWVDTPRLTASRTLDLIRYRISELSELIRMVQDWEADNK